MFQHIKVKAKLIILVIIALASFLVMEVFNISRLEATYGRSVEILQQSELPDKDRILKEQAAEFQQTRVIILSVLGISVCLVILTAVLIARDIIKPMKDTMICINAMKEGDYSKALPEQYRKRKDDFGSLARCLEDMRSAASSLIGRVQTEADGIGRIVEQMDGGMNRLSDNITEVSKTTGELSAGMEETAAATERVNRTSVEIHQAVEGIAVCSREGAAKALEIHRRAQDTMKKVVQAKGHTAELQENIRQDLEQALEQAKIVEQIYDLTDAIMGITSQTNLLALNASIEAARAGELGKGFAVVAGEIGTLADESRKTVVKIQDVTKGVTEAVENLSGNARKILEFVIKDVSNDYEDFMKAGQQFSQDADYMEQMAEGLKMAAGRLSTSVEGVKSSMEQIARAAEEGALGVGQIARKSTQVMEESRSVLRQAASSRESALVLNREISRFVIS